MDGHKERKKKPEVKILGDYGADAPLKLKKIQYFTPLKKNKRNSGENWRSHIPEKVNHHLNLN